MLNGKTVYDMSDEEYEDFRKYATNLEQGTDEWSQARLGLVTASMVAGIMPGKKGAYTASRKNYMIELITEILTGEQGESFFSKDMQRGIEKEPIARGMYEGKKGLLVDTVGLIPHPTIRGLAASPDGIVGKDTGLEIKCPKSATHVATMIYGKINDEYIPQMITGMLCTERPYWDFVSFDDRLPEDQQMVIIRHSLADFKEYAESLIFEVSKFILEMKLLLAAVKGRHN